MGLAHRCKVILSFPETIEPANGDRLTENRLLAGLAYSVTDAVEREASE